MCNYKQTIFEQQKYVLLNAWQVLVYFFVTLTYR